MIARCVVYDLANILADPPWPFGVLAGRDAASCAGGRHRSLSAPSSDEAACIDFAWRRRPEFHCRTGCPRGRILDLPSKQAKGSPMSKGMDQKRETKKKPAKTLNEKRAAKREKRQMRGR